jgi:hypothetical protein
MQDDSSAVEAWALAFLAHGNVNGIQLELPTTSGPADAGRHWQRLLYRLDRFCDLFPDAVSVIAPEGVAWPTTPASRLVLNQPLGHRNPPIAHASRMAALVSGVGASESALEVALEVSPAFKAQFGLDKVMRQWPVGLFREHVAEGNHLFTGGKSAIDLIGVRGKTLFIFELKRAGNTKAGIISELLFYSSVMRDALGKPPLFGFETPTSPRHCVVSSKDIQQCDRIEAIMLAPEFHPIVTPTVIEMLNRSMAERWIDRPVRISRVKFNIAADDFEFDAADRTSWF